MIIILCLLVSSVSVRAQFPSKFKSVDMMSGIGGYSGSRTVFNPAFSNYEINYYIQKKDSTGMLTRSKIYYDNDQRHYLKIPKRKDQDSARLYASETIKINYYDRSVDKTIEGLGTDSCWLFKVLDGKISLYACFPPPDELTNEVLMAFQILNGPIQKLSADGLREIVKDHPKSMEALEKRNYLKAVKKYN